MENLSKGEFLSFLYSEKSRELENNNAPGWSIWAIWGIIISIALFVYDKIKNYEVDINITSLYFVLALSGLLIFINHLFYRRYRLYSHIRLRRLIDEAPVLLYIVRGLLSILGLCISIVLRFEWYCYMLWGIASLINVYIICYVCFYKDKIVRAGLKTNIFSKDKNDLFVNFIQSALYWIIYYLQSYHITNIDFRWDEFEFAISMLFIIVGCCLLINFSQRNKTAEGIDRIIDAITGEFIDQKEAYKQYIYLVYGKNVSQIVDNEMKQVLSVQEKYQSIKTDLLNIKTKIDNQGISIVDLKGILLFLDRQNLYSLDCVKTFKKINKKYRDILRLNLPIIVVKDLESALADLDRSIDLQSNIISQISQVREALDLYIKNHLYCSKMDGLCEVIKCKYRKDPISWKYKLKLQIMRMYYRLLRR